MWRRELLGCSTDRSETRVPLVVASAWTDAGWTRGRDLGVVRATWAKGGCQDTDSTPSMMCVCREVRRGQVCPVEGRNQSHAAGCHF